MTFETKDSGQRRVTETGSQRDVRTGKGRYDLLPGKQVNQLMSCEFPEVCIDPLSAGIHAVCQWVDSGGSVGGSRLAWSVAWLLADEGGYTDGPSDVQVFARAIQRVTGLYERGAEKYGDDNWKKGQPLSWYIDSGARHFFMYLAGHRDEDHAAAVIWNVLGYMWTKDNVK
jgi:hypothetical protein